MYRNVYYDRRHQQMRLWTWDDQGNPIETVESFKPYIYLEHPTGTDGVSIFNTKLRKIEFETGWDRREYIKDNPFDRYFYNLPEEQQYLIEKFKDSYSDLDFSRYPLKIYFLDIEVDTHIYNENTIIKINKLHTKETSLTLKEFRNIQDKENYEVWDVKKQAWIEYNKSCYFTDQEFPDSVEAKYPINLITVCDYTTQKYYTFGLEKDYTPDNKKEKYIKCDSETDLLQKFIRFWEYEYPDIVSGYNSDNFDMPYIINRIKNKLGESQIKRLSPVKNVYTKLVKASRFKIDQFVDKWFISGITLVDYMDVYRQFARGDRESYSLDYIGKYEGVGGKTNINATSLAILSETDWSSFVRYNIQDVKLLSALEDKLKYISIMRMLANRGLSPIDKALGKVYIINGAFALQALKHDKIIPTFKTDDRGSYMGGYVKEPIPGLADGITSYDANSLYPSAIITLNLSPETKIGKIIRNNDSVKIFTVDGKEYDLTNEKFDLFIKKNNVSVSCANILFSQNKIGIMAELMNDVYKIRVENKNDAALHEKERAKYHKNSNEYKQHSKIMSDRDIMQYTLKIFLNSVYGAMANPGCAAFDLDLSSSITNTGRAVAKQASIIIDGYATSKYDISNSITTYSDTDSVHITLKPILDKLNELLFKEHNKLSDKTYELAIEFNEILNKEISQWAKNILNSKDDRFYFKRETICSAVLYEAKKQYIMHILDKGEKDPMPCDKIKPVGMALAKSIYSDEVKLIIKDIVKQIFETKNRKDTTDIYKQSYEKFKTLNILQLSFRTNVKDLDKCGDKTEGLITPKGTPVHVKSTIYYNYFIDKLNLSSKYSKITSGTKVKWFYCAKNKYNIKTIAFNNEYPKELEEIFKPDYSEMFSKLIASSIQRLYDCLDWRMPDIKKNFANDLLDLFNV